jgi:hypothetical protein
MQISFGSLTTKKDDRFVLLGIAKSSRRLQSTPTIPAPSHNPITDQRLHNLRHLQRLYNMNATMAPPANAITPPTAFCPAAPVNWVAPPVPVGIIDMLTMLGLVALEPAAQDGTATAERVTITSAAGPVGQAGLIVIVEVAGAVEFWLL